jgi:hypothetical protein
LTPEEIDALPIAISKLIVTFPMSGVDVTLVRQ